MNQPSALPLVGRWLLYGFALFTLACHATVLTGGNLCRLIVLAPTLMIAAFIAHRMWGSSDPAAPDPKQPPLHDAVATPGDPGLEAISGQNRLTLLVLIVAVALTLLCQCPKKTFNLPTAASLLISARASMLLDTTRVSRSERRTSTVRRASRPPIRPISDATDARTYGSGNSDKSTSGPKKPDTS